MIYGLDIGGTKIELAIYDTQHNKQNAWRVQTPKNDYQEFLAVLKDIVAEADHKSGTQGSVGIGLPCVFDDHGRAIAASIPCINNQPLAEDIAHALGRHVTFQNDVRAFVFSEAYGGAADGHENVLGVVLGTGVGGGLCFGGEIYQSRQNVACEFGHVPLSAILQQRYNFPLRRCGCGLSSCLNQYISGPGLEWMCTHFNSNHRGVKELIAGVRANEANATKVFNAYIDCLGAFFAQLTLMYDPDIIVLGGGISNIREIFQRLPTAIAPYLFSGVDAPTIVAPKFGDSSGVRGVAILGQQALFEIHQND
jgi:N-acetylglucosamine kinase